MGFPDFAAALIRNNSVTSFFAGCYFDACLLTQEPGDQYRSNIRYGFNR
jgi:hypothetical protein